MAKYHSSDFLSWDDDLDLDAILGEYTADECKTEKSRVKEDVTYMCPECNKEYKSISGFRGHVVKKHDKILRASDHRKNMRNQSKVHVHQTPVTSEISKFQEVFPKAYKKSLNNMQSETLYNIFDDTEKTIASACCNSVAVEHYFHEFLSNCFKDNNVSCTEERESFFKTFHAYRTNEQLLLQGVTAIKEHVKAYDSLEIINFIQVFILDLIGEIMNERKAMEVKQSNKEQSTISDADNSILFYIAGFIIRSLENKYYKLQNKEEKDKHLADIAVLVNCSSEKSFTETFSVWYKKKNRGGLKKPSDDFFFLIREFERIVRDLDQPASGSMSKSDIKEDVLSSYMVMHYSEKLFEPNSDLGYCTYVEDALDIFLTVRGHAQARVLQRQHKQDSLKKPIKGKSSASLRDVLKCISNNS